MKQKLIQASTLLLFIGLISVFVLYRSGKIDKALQLSPNGGTINTVHTDTTKIIKPYIMSSSKSIIISEQQIKKQDSIVDNATRKMKSVLDSATWEIMSSSKSGVIIKFPSLKDSIKFIK